MSNFNLKLGDYILIRNYPVGDNCDLIAKVLVIKSKIITNIDIVVIAKHPSEFVGESFSFKCSEYNRSRIIILGQSPILTALYG